ncbi:alanine racemase [Nonlabens tegetincola]
MRVADISVSAIRKNVRRVSDLTGGGNVIVVVKACGYGHDAAIAASAAMAGGATMIATADLEEALQLRERGIDAPLLCWLHGPRVDFVPAIEQSIDIGVAHLRQLEALAGAARATGRPATLQFKIDTGLSRNGAAREEWDELFRRGAELEREGLVHVRGIFSHLANAGEEADLAQGAKFDEAVALLRAAGCEPAMIHLAASAATFTRPELYYNTVRVGVAAFGLSPFVEKNSAQLGLTPAMTLRSEVVALRGVPAGTGVSYGFNHVCEVATTLALVPVGYADGMPRALNGSGAWVTIADERCPIVGRIGMDQFIVDVGPIAGRIDLGAPVVLFGDPERGYPSIDNWARLMRTINYEILVGIGPRVLRRAVDETAVAEAESATGETAAGEVAAGEVAVGETAAGVATASGVTGGDAAIGAGPTGEVGA